MHENTDVRLKAPRTQLYFSKALKRTVAFFPLDTRCKRSCLSIGRKDTVLKRIIKSINHLTALGSKMTRQKTPVMLVQTWVRWQMRILQVYRLHPHAFITAVVQSATGSIRPWQKNSTPQLHFDEPSYCAVAFSCNGLSHPMLPTQTFWWGVFSFHSLPELLNAQLLLQSEASWRWWLTLVFCLFFLIPDITRC